MIDNGLMHEKLHAWLRHNRRRDGWDGIGNEACRLTHDQAMTLCFERSDIDKRGSSNEKDCKRALAAYRNSRPWDYLASSDVYPRVVPLGRHESADKSLTAATGSPTNVGGRQL